MKVVYILCVLLDEFVDLKAILFVFFVQHVLPVSKSQATDPPTWTKRCCCGQDAIRPWSRYQSLFRKSHLPVYTRPPCTLVYDWLFASFS